MKRETKERLAVMLIVLGIMVASGVGYPEATFTQDLLVGLGGVVAGWVGLRWLTSSRPKKFVNYCRVNRRL